MSTDFGSILRGLMANRRLTNRVLSRASGRAESTINQLLNGGIPPTTELLQDIAPSLQVTVADLLVIAGLPSQGVSTTEGPYASAREIGSLVATASSLPPEQVELLIAHARHLHETGAGADR
jgi:transcriptional regulator with XRE-family HTH domain